MGSNDVPKLRLGDITKHGQKFCDCRRVIRAGDEQGCRISLKKKKRKKPAPQLKDLLTPRYDKWPQMRPRTNLQRMNASQKIRRAQRSLDGRT